MTSDDKSILRSEITRRDSIKRGALAGAVLWSAPVIRAVNLAQGGEPKSPTGGHDISYIAMNVVKNGQKYVVKWEVDENAWDSSPGAFPFCESIFTPDGARASGSSLGLTVSAPNSTSGCITITVPPGTVVTSSAHMGGTVCCAGPTGSGSLVFCPC